MSVDGPHNYYVSAPAANSDDGSRYLVHNKTPSVSDGQAFINNTIITNSTGGDCYGSGGTNNFLGSNNLIDDHASGDCSDISSAVIQATPSSG